MTAQATILSSLRERLQRTTAEPERLSLFGLLCRELAENNPSEALSELEKASSLAQRLNRVDQEAEFYELRGDCLCRLDRLSEARSVYRRSGDLYASIDEIENAARVYQLCGNLAVQSGAMVEGLRTQEKVFELYKRENNSVSMMNSLKLLGDLQGQLKNFAQAFEHYQNGLKVAEFLEDTSAIGVFRLDLGIVASQLGHHAHALEHINCALDVFRAAKHPLLEVRALVNLSAVLAEQGDVSSALEHILKALVIYELLGDKKELAAALINAGELYEENGRSESALNLYLQGQELFEEMDDDVGRSAVLLSIGNLHRKTKRYHDSLWFLEQALHFAEQTRDIKREAECHELLAHSLQGIGDSSGAVAHLWKYIELSRKLNDREQQESAAEMQAKFDLERIEKEQQIWKLKSEQLEAEMRQKSAELTALTLQLVAKHRFIEELLTKIETIEKSTTEEAQPLTQEVLGEIKRSVSTSDDWSIFQEQFSKVHHDLMHRIASRWPLLSPAELRTCALIVTGLSKSEMADLLRVSERTVETYRYRIRKVLEIDSKTNLSTFLQGV